MTIGIDLRIFQIGHQYRGIGAHIKNLIKEFSAMEDLPNFVFFEHPNVESGLDIIKEYLPELNYEVRYTNNRLIGESYLHREWVSFKNRLLRGDAGMGKLSDIDVLLCVDFNLGVPRPHKVKSVVISYDMIPWVLSEYYLPSFMLTYNKTHSIKKGIKAGLEKYLYFHKFKQANIRADRIISISEQTKNDLIKYLGIDPNKITTILLGISTSKTIGEQTKQIPCTDIDGNPLRIHTEKTDYIFFMGGADRRRRIEDLVEAFDLAARKNKNLKLILAGYDFKSLHTVPDITAKNSIMDSRNKNKIYFAGFTTESEKNALFYNAIAFVFPSIYEGFGLPILEAMDLSCPVITYKNSSLIEVGGHDAVLYAKNVKDIAAHIQTLQEDKKMRRDLISNGKERLKKFSWKDTAEKTLMILKQY
jgi:glycosyltransferase involved in cell wall biosynthesis